VIKFSRVTVLERGKLQPKARNSEIPLPLKALVQLFDPKTADLMPNTQHQQIDSFIFRTVIIPISTTTN